MNQELFYTSQIKVAAALVTMGFERAEPRITKIRREDGSSSIVFWFNPRNRDGVMARDVFRKMTRDADAFLASHPDDPINWMRCVQFARDGLVSEIHEAQAKVEVRGSSGHRAAITATATDAQKDQIARIL
jgi:hypothetical protein